MDNNRPAEEKSIWAKRLDAAEAFDDVFKIADEMDAEIIRLNAEVKRLKEYEWMYKDLCK